MEYKKPIVFIFSFVFLFTIFFNLNTKIINASIDCLAITPASSQSDKDACRVELANIEKELSELLKKQEEQKKNTGTLTGDVNYLNTQIKALQTKVKARAIAIASLKVSITEKVSKIENLSTKIKSQHESIAQLLRNTNDFDNENLVHLLLSDKSLSDFYSDLESYSSIKQAVKDSVDEIRGIKTETEIEKKDLEEKRNAETDAKVELESAQKKVSQTEAEKKKLLSLSKQKETEYQKLAAEKKAKADKIRSALFSLAGVSKGIPFGTALAYAKNAQKETGIDPAFLLAIFTKESNLGSNVGQCFVTDTVTGEGKGANTGSAQIRVMSPTRDIPPFLEITEKLGISYSSTRVSCWIKDYRNGVPFGWGGAMGPAQFIPSTWKLFIPRLEKALGYYPNPWEPKDAFMASSLYLTDLGAVGDSASKQNIAACKYYGTGGSSCAYSRSVATLKAKIQDDIDLLSN